MRLRFVPLAALLLAALLCSPAPANAENHALILAISNYIVKPLPGVAKDVENASLIARTIGVPEQNIMIRKDEELSKDGLRLAINEFSARVRPGDHVFVYYSGHGTSYLKPGTAALCEKALVGQDISLLPRDEFHKLLAPLAARAGKLFVFLDSCFSGGMFAADGSRAFSADGRGPARPKFMSREGSDSCSRASNLVGSRDGAFGEAKATPNYYLLGSAAQDEVAIDGGETIGGFASAAVRSCLEAPEAADTDKDGVVSLEELRRCAQGRVNERMAEDQRHDPSYPYSKMTLTASFGEGGNAPVLFSGAQMSVVHTPQFLRSLFEGRDARRSVTLTAAKNPLRIGEDMSLTLTSDRTGYVTLLGVGSSGNIFKLFPNALDAETTIEAGRPLHLPRPHKWRIQATPPAGDNWLLALVSENPHRFKDQGQDAGIFKNIGDSGASARGLFDFLFKPANDCARQGRDFGALAADPCSTAYGAALLKITETE